MRKEHLGEEQEKTGVFYRAAKHIQKTLRQRGVKD